MIDSIQKTSLRIPSQLPAFIREDSDYETFVLFLQAYYEWLEQENNVLDRTKNILNYRDVDKTSEEFINYFINEFFHYFPQEALISKSQAVKVAKQLYESKGTPASYKFLFRMLYNSDCELFNTEEAVFIASSGEWYQPKYLNVATVDHRFLGLGGYLIFGETSKAIALIENSILGGIEGLETQIFISNIERQFQSGEYVIVVDNQLQPIIINGEQLRAQVVGQVLSITVDPNRRGLLYEVGDPVVVDGGLNSGPTTGAANAIVSKVTQGSILRIDVLTGGYGYRPAPNTIIHLSDAPGAFAVVGSVDTNPSRTVNVSFIAMNDIQPSINVVIGSAVYGFLTANTATGNASGSVITTEQGNVIILESGDTTITDFVVISSIVNANTILYDAFDFLSYQTYPISSVLVLSGGTGIKKVPSVLADSIYATDVPSANVIYPDADTGHLKSLGILGPVLIANGGFGYAVNDTLTFNGGRGWGAYANVTTVDGTGAITKITYREDPSPGLQYPPGGMGYTVGNMPIVSVLSNTGSGAQVYVPTILGDGATFAVVTDSIGAILKIDVLDGGKNYVSKPNVSLKITDLAVSNISLGTLPLKNDIVFQGTDFANATYIATVNSVSQLTFSIPHKFNLRVFDYNSAPDFTKPINVLHKNIIMTMETFNDPHYSANGIRSYGDGTAFAVANFENGLSSGKGQYLSGKGHPSGFSVLENEIYNTFTYEIIVEKEIAKYRDILLNLLHPTGIQALGKFVLRAEQKLNLIPNDEIYQGHPIQDFTGINTYVTLGGGESSNLLHVNSISIANIANVIFSNDFIRISSNTGPNIQSEILEINYTANTIALKENVWLAWANVAYTSGVRGSNVISILGFTSAYNIINGGVYNNPNTPILDMLSVGDKITLSNNHSCSNISGPGGSNISGPGGSTSEWYAIFGDLANKNQFVYGSSVVYDSTGNVYVIGGIDANTNTNDVNSAIITTTTVPQAIVVKYDSTGNLLWKKIINDNSSVMFNKIGYSNSWLGVFELGDGIAVDSSDNLYLTISTNAFYGPNTGYGGIIKLDSSGNKLIANVFNVGASFSSCTACTAVVFSIPDIAVSSTQNMYVVGTTQDTRSPQFDTAYGPQQIYVAKLYANGVIAWTKTLYQDGVDFTYELTLSSDTPTFNVGETIYQSFDGTFTFGQVIASGSVLRFDQANNKVFVRGPQFVSFETGFFPQNILFSLTSTNTRVVTAKTSQSQVYGTHAATDTYYNVANRGYGIVLDSNNNSYIVGEAIVPTVGYGKSNTYIVVAKYNDSGILQWHKELGAQANIDTSIYDANTYSAAGLGIDLDSNGNIYIAGATNFNPPTYLFENSSLTPDANISGGTYRSNTSALLVKYDNNGNLIWQRTLGAEGQVAHGVKVDSNNDIFISGIQKSIGNFNPPTANAKLKINDNLLEAGGRSTNNMFIACYSANGNMNWQRTFGSGYEGQQYTWGTKTISSKGSKLSMAGFTTNPAYGNSSLIVTQLEKGATSGNSFGTWGIIKYQSSLFANNAGGLSTTNISMSQLSSIGWQEYGKIDTIPNIINITNFPGYANAPTMTSNTTYIGSGNTTTFLPDSANIIVTFIDTGNNLIYLDRSLCTTANSLLSVNHPPFVTSNVIVFKQLGLTAN